ncbi:MAG: efflux RND transporter periplasmic adaptor subunit [Acidobacteriota bacterium]|nr:efflux RND transporter periplasmic adaptor subunit [Acidobacteriota bacterium]
MPGCSSQKAQSAPSIAVPVVVAPAVEKTVPVELRAIGNVQAYNTVQVKTQVPGELTGVFFKEGDDVKRGQLLFTLDPRPLESDLKRQQATLARDQAEAANARAQATRYAKLMEEGVVAREQYDQYRTQAEAMEAVAQADKNAVETARLQLAYTRIFAPLAGRTGSLLVHRGNIVKENDDKSVLVAINQLTPIYVEFAVPERYLPQVKAQTSAGKLKVQAMAPGQTEPEEGTLTFLDNTVDPTTGTIRMKGTFDNPSRRLWPGQFVDVVLRLSERPNAVVVPTQAVQTGQQGQFVFVIKNDMTAEQRPVKAGQAVEGETIIEQGVQPGERVVTDGQLRLVPGSRVEVRQAATGASPASAATSTK